MSWLNENKLYEIARERALTESEYRSAKPATEIFIWMYNSYNNTGLNSDDYILHHIDGDHDNIAVDNLVILPKKLHDWLHSRYRWDLRRESSLNEKDQLQKHLDEICEQDKIFVSDIIRHFADFLREQSKQNEDIL